jgi:hypothetical protein
MLIFSPEHKHMLITAVKTRQGEMAGRKDHVAGPGKGSGCSCTALRKASRHISQLYDTAKNAPNENAIRSNCRRRSVVTPPIARCSSSNRPVSTVMR